MEQISDLNNDFGTASPRSRSGHSRPPQPLTGKGKESAAKLEMFSWIGRVGTACTSVRSRERERERERERARREKARREKKNESEKETKKGTQ
ncbi:hypothetical protein LY78DRAFT_423281 [Colletotrichum sublineola]|nr:hypothetical protein LY78DRAFT_423281 [Colletotrichum sublineola]